MLRAMGKMHIVGGGSRKRCRGAGDEPRKRAERPAGANNRVPGDGGKDTKNRELGCRGAELHVEAANKGDRGAKNRPEKRPDDVAERAVMLAVSGPRVTGWRCNARLP